jgi:MFS family permease
VPFVTPLGMSLEAIGLYSIAWLIGATTPGVLPDHLWLVALLFLNGFGQGLATPGLMHMVIGRVPPDFSGMIAGVTSSTLQVSVALSVAVIGGVFYALSGERADAGMRSAGSAPMLANSLTPSLWLSSSSPPANSSARVSA